MSTLLEQASLVLIPSGYKEDTVYSVIPSNGSGDMSFTRASDGTRINSDGLVENTPWNLLQYSEQFNNAVYTTSNATITSNSITAPNDTLTADTITSTTIGSEARTRQTITQLGNSVYSLSCYAKKGNVDWFILRNLAVNSAGGSRAWFNLNTGAVGTTNSGVSATIQNVGNGWYRCTIYGTTDATPLSLVDIAPSSSDNVFLSNAIGEFVYIWGAQLNIGTTAKPYFPTTDRLNVPRLTYQNGGGGCPSLLLEPQRTNILTYSNEFSNAAWSKNTGAILSNNATSPDGTTNASKLVGITSTTQQWIYRLNIAVVSGTQYTFSIFAKKGEYNFIQLRNLTNINANTVFNINTGTIHVTTTGTAKIDNLGNGWYRCSVTATATATGNSQIYVNLSTDGTEQQSFLGDGTSGVYIYGAQHEAGAYQSFYIPTVASSATRIADICSKTGISSLIGQTEGVLFADFVINGRTNNTNILNSEKNTVCSFFFSANTNGNIDCGLFASAVTKARITAGSVAVNQRAKVAYAYKSGNSALYINGVQVGTSADTYTLPSTLDDIFLNDITTYFSYQESVNFNQVILFPTRLTNAQLVTLTTI